MDANALILNQTDQASSAARGRGGSKTHSDSASRASFAKFLDAGQSQANSPSYQQNLVPGFQQDEQLTKFPSNFLSHIFPSLDGEFEENFTESAIESEEIDGSELQYQWLGPQQESQSHYTGEDDVDIADTLSSASQSNAERASLSGALKAVFEKSEASDTLPSQPVKSDAAPTTPIIQATASPHAQHAQFAAQVQQATQVSSSHQTTAPSDLAQQVGLQIAQKAQEGQNRFTIRLDPPELGRIDIKMTVSHDGTVQAALSVDNENTFDLLQRDQRGLERALENAGLKADSGGLSFSLKQQGNGQFADEGQSQHRQGAYNGDAEADADMAAVSSALAEKIAASSRPLDVTV